MISRTLLITGQFTHSRFDQHCSVLIICCQLSMVCNQLDCDVYVIVYCLITFTRYHFYCRQRIKAVLHCITHETKQLSKVPRTLLSTYKLSTTSNRINHNKTEVKVINFLDCQSETRRIGKNAVSLCKSVEFKAPQYVPFWVVI